MLAAGGALGLLGAAWAIDVLVPLLPADVPRVENIGLHLPVLAFTVGGARGDRASFVGVWPALEASRGGAGGVGRRISRAATPARRRASRTRDVLVVGADRGDAVAA